MLQSISCTKIYFTLLYYNTNTAVVKYNRIFFSGVKLSKEVCVNHIENEPVLVKVEEVYFCMISHQIHQLLHMQGCGLYFHGSIMGMYPIERWFYQKILIPPLWKHFPMSTKYISIEKKRFFRCKYRNSSVILIREIQQQNALERLSATWCLRL